MQRGACFPTGLKTNFQKGILDLNFRLPSGIETAKAISEAICVAVHVGHLLKISGNNSIK